MKTQGHLKRLVFCLLLLIPILVTSPCCAQKYDTASVFKVPVQLDSITISSGFDINAFIRRVKADTTFYKAFKNLHFLEYSSVNDITAYDKDGERIASYHSKTKQDIKDHCRTTHANEEQATGDFYKRNGDYNYYTAALFDHLFFAKEPICNESNIVAGDQLAGTGPMAKSENQLKQLIFNPGSRVSGVPFMGDRASIFDEDEAGKYDFKIVQEIYDGQPCYVFRITPKTGYETKVLYNELSTWFRKGDYSIVARDYSLSYHTLVYDFDVRMKVHTKQTGDKLYPTYIAYDGNWHVFTRKREWVKFTIAISY